MACRLSRPFSFVTHRIVRVIDAYDRNADRISSAPLKMGNLLDKVARYSINLLNHCFGENFDLNPDLNGRNGTARYGEPRIDNRRFPGNDFSKSSVSSPGVNPASAILNIENASALPDSLHELG